MKPRLFLALALIFGFASLAAAGAHVRVKPSDETRYRRLNDHPRAQPVANQEIKIEITTDDILRSCCKAPDLIVSGKVTNIAPQPIDYIRLIIALKDGNGRVVYTEDTYNHGAVTMFEDPAIAKILNEKPHFDRLVPGASDTFVFTIPTPILPSYKTALVLATDVVRNSTIAGSH